MNVTRAPLEIADPAAPEVDAAAERKAWTRQQEMEARGGVERPDLAALLARQGATPGPRLVPPPPADLAAVEAERRAVAERLKKAALARAAAKDDPAVLLAEGQASLARERREAEAAEQELLADAIYREACGRLGDDLVAIFPTPIGPIVLRAPTEDEGDRTLARASAHVRAAAGAKNDAEAQIHRRNEQEVWRLGLRATVLTDPDHFDRATKRYPGIWRALSAASGALTGETLRAAGKGGGRS